MSGMLTAMKNEKPEWIRPVHTVRVWIPSQPPAGEREPEPKRRSRGAGSSPG